MDNNEFENSSDSPLGGGGERMHAGATKWMYQRARELRNNATHAEQLLWNYLRTKPCGRKFRRQHPYAIYILDFYCHSLKLVIEVDGSIHDLPDVKMNDGEREDKLKADGLKVIRIRNEQIKYHLDDVILFIQKIITELEI